VKADKSPDMKGILLQRAFTFAFKSYRKIV